MHDRATAARGGAAAGSAHTGRPARLTPEQKRQLQTLRGAGEQACRRSQAVFRVASGNGGGAGLKLRRWRRKVLQEAASFRAEQ